MKIQLLSDLHFEFFNAQNEHLGKVQISQEADVVALVGDIDNGDYALKRAHNIAMEFGKPVIFLPGNHEFYRQEIKETLKKYRQGAHGVFVLLGIDYPNLKPEETHVVIDGVRFIGGTLWTDFKLYEGSVRMPTKEMAMSYVGQGINDFRVIKYGSRSFTPQDSLDYHNGTIKLIQSVLNIPFDGKNVLLSHHGVHANSIVPQYRAAQSSLDSKTRLPNENTNFMINPGFSSHLPDLLAKFDLALHGHTHSSLDYLVGKCRVVANPRGYPMSRSGNIVWENPDYEPIKLIEI